MTRDLDKFKCLQTITKKRKNRSSKNNAAPKEPVCPPPPPDNRIVHVQESVKPFASFSSTLNTLSTPKLPVKSLQEISNDYYVEVIPAASSIIENQPLMLDNVSPPMPESEDIPTSKRKGRPLGSKNKNKNDINQTPLVASDVSPMEDIVDLEASNSKIISQ